MKNRNNIIAGLIVATGIFFVGALFTDVANLGGLGFITGMSAISTRFLIKENA